ncbi:MAG TPA: flagellar hook-basal body complex protein FliE [Terracidiphilus sp.]|nr:flagellar hook-basal body complex protein FliE [Terracidiphilus sp.]
MSSVFAPAATMSALLSNAASQAFAVPTPPSSDASSPFSDLLTDAVGQVNQLEQQAQTAVTGLMTGHGVDVHQAMIATEKADMAFELALAVRNKAVQAYQTVIGMQF